MTPECGIAVFPLEIISKFVRGADTFIQHFVFCIFFVKLELTDLLSYPDMHIIKSHRHKPMAFSGDPERTRTVDLQRDRLAC